MTTGQMVDVEVTIVLTYPVPADLRERERCYGTTDLSECVQIDIDNDPASFFLDSTLSAVTAVSEKGR